MAGLEVLADGNGARTGGLEVFADDPVQALEARRRALVGPPAPLRPSFLDVLGQVAGGLVDDLSAGLQGTSPVMRGFDGAPNYQPLGELFESDSGPSFVAADGSWSTVDPRAHVVLRDPDTEKLTVYARSPETDETLGAAGRILGVGAMTGPATSMLRGAQSAAEVAGIADRIAPAIGPGSRNGGAVSGRMKYNPYDAEDVYQAALQGQVPSAKPPGGRGVVEPAPGSPAAQPGGDDFLSGRGAGRHLLPGLKSPEGVPIEARHVVGRRAPGGPDHTLTPEETLDAIKRIADEYAVVPRSQIGGDLGETFSRRTPDGYRQSVRIGDGLGPAQTHFTHQHELGHLLDYPSSGSRWLGNDPALRAEAKRVSKNNIRPETWASRGDRSTSLNSTIELMADMARAYQANPTHFKKAHPGLAKLVREAFNNGPYRDIIQFNSLAPWLVGGAAGLGVLANLPDEGM